MSTFLPPPPIESTRSSIRKRNVVAPRKELIYVDKIVSIVLEIGNFMEGDGDGSLKSGSFTTFGKEGFLFWNMNFYRKVFVYNHLNDTINMEKEKSLGSQKTF